MRPWTASVALVVTVASLLVAGPAVHSEHLGVGRPRDAPPGGAVFVHGLRAGAGLVVETSNDGTTWTPVATGALAA